MKWERVRYRAGSPRVSARQSTLICPTTCPHYLWSDTPTLPRLPAKGKENNTLQKQTKTKLTSQSFPSQTSETFGSGRCLNNACGLTPATTRRYSVFATNLAGKSATNTRRPGKVRAAAGMNTKGSSHWIGLLLAQPNTNDTNTKA